MAQAELSDRKANDAVNILFESIPFEQDVEKGKRPANVRFEVVPSLVGHVLEVADVSQHREYSFDDHANVPDATLTGALTAKGRRYSATLLTDDS